MRRRDVMAVILGGGQGSRLYPLTALRAKPAVPLFGKYRLIDIPISNCINSDINKIFVLTQFLSASLNRHVMQAYKFEPFSDGFVEILAAEQTPKSRDWFQGTADAVRATLHHIHYYNCEHTLVLSGDHLYRMDYRKMIAFHEESNADITLAVQPVSRDDAPRMGLLRATESGEIEEFVEKPSDPEVLERFRAPKAVCERAGLPPNCDRFLGSMGIYVFRPSVLEEVLTGSQVDFGKEIIPKAIDNFKVAAFPFRDYWADIGTIGSFFDVNLSAVKPNPPFQFYAPHFPTYTRVRNLSPARVIQSEVKDCLIAEGADVHGGQIVHSVLGVRSVVRPGAHLNEVVMMGSDFFEGEMVLRDVATATGELPPMGIGEGAHIERCIVDKNARIGANVVVTRKEPDASYDGENYCVRDGITVIEKGAIIPSGSRI